MKITGASAFGGPQPGKSKSKILIIYLFIAQGPYEVASSWGDDDKTRSRDKKYEGYSNLRKQHDDAKRK